MLLRRSKPKIMEGLRRSVCSMSWPGSMRSASWAAAKQKHHNIKMHCTGLSDAARQHETLTGARRTFSVSANVSTSRSI